MTELRESTEEYIPREVIAAIPSELVDLFEHQVLAVLEELSLNMPFVSLTFFKNKVLPRRIEYNAAKILSHILVSKMITDGRLVLEQDEDSKYTDRKVTT